jgi:hypothetical protein
MSVIRTGSKVHDDALLAAEQTRQQSVGGSPTAAQVKAADIAYARAALASCKANNNGSGVEQFSTMLRELGTGGY